MYRLGTSTLEALAAGVPTAPVARYFEYWLLRLQGVYPPHIVCHRCGTALDAEATGANLDADGHRFTCPDCAGQTMGEDARGVTLSPDALAFLAASGRVPPTSLAGVPLSARVDRELEVVHRSLMRLHLEKELRSTRVLRDLRR